MTRGTYEVWIDRGHTPPYAPGFIEALTIEGDTFFLARQDLAIRLGVEAVAIRPTFPDPARCGWCCAPGHGEDACVDRRKRGA